MSLAPLIIGMLVVFAILILLVVIAWRQTKPHAQEKQGGNISPTPSSSSDLPLFLPIFIPSGADSADFRNEGPIGGTSDGSGAEGGRYDEGHFGGSDSGGSDSGGGFGD